MNEPTKRTGGSTPLVRESKRPRKRPPFPAPFLVTAVIYWLAQIAVGTDTTVATLCSIAILFGLYAIPAAGGLRTVPGVLNLVILTRLLLVGIALKVATGQAIDSHLRSPRVTAAVMALGFFGLWLGCWIYRGLPRPRGVIHAVKNADTYFSLAVVFTVLTTGSAALVVLKSTSYDTQLTGGYWGVLQYLATLKAFSVVLVMYYVWAKRSPQFLSHPLVLTVLAIEVAVGIAGVTKQGIMEPVACYLFVAFVRYGWRSRAIWSLAAGGAVLYLSVAYPYSQYVRMHGGREGNLRSRLAVIKRVFFEVASDSQYRKEVESEVIQDYGWLNKKSLTPLNRMALVGDASHLIDATATTHSFTRWGTIVVGFQMAVPSFIYHNKPTSSGGNYLGHIAGDLPPDDMTTQVSYGVMANLYNAFGYRGALIGSVIFFCCFYYVLRFWFRSARLTPGPYGSSVWFIFLVLSNHHIITESPLAAMIPQLVNLVVIAVLVRASRWLRPYIPTSFAPVDKPASGFGGVHVGA